MSVRSHHGLVCHRLCSVCRLLLQQLAHDVGAFVMLMIADSELPMQPITIMRNALGRDQGGSGVAIDPEAYMASVKYWSAHAPIQ